MAVDPYSANPLAQEMEQRDPFRFGQISIKVAPPKMFAGGTSDVPAFTASGIDPQQLLRLPYGLRHAAATNPNIVEVYSWFENYAGYPEAVIDSDGLREARWRMESWMNDTDLDLRTPEQRDADSRAEYQELSRTWDRDGLTEDERKAKNEADRTAKWEAQQAAHKAAAVPPRRW